jgi:hypothetical protein
MEERDEVLHFLLAERKPAYPSIHLCQREFLAAMPVQVNH